jgi:hypothetical protein
MERGEIIRALKSLTDKQFIELFYEAAAGRNVYHHESEHTESRLILANAERDKMPDSRFPEWQFQLLCPTPGDDWHDESPICQFGQHCGYETASWAKKSICPVCGDEVYGT